MTASLKVMAISLRAAHASSAPMTGEASAMVVRQAQHVPVARSMSGDEVGNRVARQPLIMVASRLGHGEREIPHATARQRTRRRPARHAWALQLLEAEIDQTLSHRSSGRVLGSGDAEETVDAVDRVIAHPVAPFEADPARCGPG